MDFTTMRIATLCYLFDKKKNKILFGAKKYGGAKGKINGFGGKVEESDKSMREAVKREFWEETGVKLTNPKLRSVLIFHFEDKEVVPLYLYFATKWQGNPKESEEMKVFWIDRNVIPFEKMWPGDQVWFPIVNRFENTVIEAYFGKNNPFPEKLTVNFRQKLNGKTHTNYQ